MDWNDPLHLVALLTNLRTYMDRADPILLAPPKEEEGPEGDLLDQIETHLIKRLAEVVGVKL
jgi:hypothetical protein